MVLQIAKTSFYKITCILFLGLWAAPLEVQSQDLKLKKGVVMDQVLLHDSLPELVSLYIPTSFNSNELSPLLCIVGTEEPLQSLRYFRSSAEKNGYVLVASKSNRDSVNLTRQVLQFNRLLQAVKAQFPINPNRIVAGGFGTGGQLAALLPGLIPEVSSAILLGAVPSDNWIKAAKQSVGYIDFMGRGDFGYQDLQIVQSAFQRTGKNFFAAYFSGGHQRPKDHILEFAFAALDLFEIRNKSVVADSLIIENRYQQYLRLLSEIKQDEDLILVHHWIEQGIDLFEGLKNTGLLKQELKQLEKTPAYRTQKREENLIHYKEQMMRSDLLYSIEEDLETLNFDNLGWWNFKIQEFQKLKKSSRLAEAYYGSRMEDFINTLATDYIQMLNRNESPDVTQKIWLYMLKTLTEPKNEHAYFQVIGLSEQIGDRGTALYYLESLLKQGFDDVDALYSIPETALLKVGPDFNRIIQNYLGISRYPPIQTDDSDKPQN
jgi:predicted esterase